MSKIIGIDLGTTNSCVAVMEGGNARVIPNEEGARTTPSIVAFTEDGERLVGKPAKRQAVTNPENTVFAVKRLIGRRFDDPIVKKDMGMVPVPDRARATTATPGSRRGGKEYSPPEISAMILQKMKADRRGLPRRDGHRGGHHRPGLLQRRPAPGDQGRRPDRRPRRACASSTSRPRRRSPTASTRRSDEKIAVYDLGGGTFDISILELGDGVFEVKSTNGDTFLGGDDFDQRIIDWLVDEFKKEQRHRPAQGPAWPCSASRRRPRRPRSSCRRRTQTEINLPFITADADGPEAPRR